MALWNWNWEEIAVFSGGWWLLIIGIVIFLLGIGWGFAWGSSRERKHQREQAEWNKKDFKSTWDTNP